MIDFLRHTRLYFLLSAIVIVLGLFSMARWGFRYSIDFVGGTNQQLKVAPHINTSEIKKVFTDNGAEIVKLEKNDNNLLLRTKALDEKKEGAINRQLAVRFKNEVQIERSETVGPVLGRETMIKTVTASVVAILGILIYMSFSFKSFHFALAAILAMVHDFLVVIGTYSLFSHFLGAELDTLFVTAILTAMSFSVHDTIIIFDKIREYRRLEGIADIERLVNRALTETLVRSLNNSMTIIFMLLALTLLGGSTIRFFVATLLVGTVTGTYSSPFIAAPILVFLEKRKAR
ncbi:protein translocase subunit SecF [Candidatus Roizmanbacteria bacterium]|nr:protein translocase subunit SecF [Candidatus Roizmanbacteria bacterium]